MKVMILADPTSAHTIKWANALNQNGVRVSLFGLKEPKPEMYENGVKLFHYPIPKNIASNPKTKISKLKYLNSLRSLKIYLRENNPNVLHAHYATSYGLLGALTNYHPFLISVWGTDIYNFPKSSPIHKFLLKYNLRHADKILSTSNVMREEIKKYTGKEIIVTPFGIDIEKFKPEIRELSTRSEKTFIIGTIKSLEKKYGIEYLIKAFHIIRDKYPDLSLKLLIVGEGTQHSILRNLCTSLNLNNDVIFTGYIDPIDIPKYHQLLDIYVSPSIEDSESFGVAALEASACGKPVIVSDSKGFTETVINNVTGFIVQKKNINELVIALEKLITDDELRVKLGKAGRNFVRTKFDLNDSVKIMLNVYRSVTRKLIPPVTND